MNLKAQCVRCLQPLEPGRTICWVCLREVNAGPPHHIPPAHQQSKGFSSGMHILINSLIIGLGIGMGAIFLVLVAIIALLFAILTAFFEICGGGFGGH